MNSISYRYSRIEDDELVSLMTSPLPFSATSSSLSSLQPLSFGDPFDDPDMEPLPLRPQGQGSQNTPLTQSMKCDCLVPSFMELLDESGVATSKRSSQDCFSYDDAGSFHVKRQRRSQIQMANDEKSTARFRPYQEKQWRAQFRKLVQYKLAHGHCCVPHSHQEDPILARWVKRQKYQYKKSKDNDPTSTMTTRRIQELESIGFIWQSHASAWQEKLIELKVFKQRTGHCNVPSHHQENLGLSTWVKCQRRQYKLYNRGAPSSLTMKRYLVLQSLGFVFEPQLSK
ncbi:unnamed protein product [Cylindrotheca closterium]|uniref:Helicase-associated domain-containing protein n=1 Tax=Cylindrotheca closterium TaxID=2856 RepID=A0AAD2CJN3_9STRA|nr:unnamed protein product [Cylindrotheca closterium]